MHSVKNTRMITVHVITYVPLTGQANLEDKIKNLQDNLQNKVDTLQDTVIDLQDKLNMFHNTTEASTRKNHHKVVELLQNTSCSFNGKSIMVYSIDLYTTYYNIFPGTEELQKQLEIITEGLQEQLQSCNRTDIFIQYLLTSCSG